MSEATGAATNDVAPGPAAPFRSRYAAYTVDLALLAPIVLLLSLGPLARAREALADLDAAMLEAFERMAPEALASALALADALRTDAVFFDAVVAISAAILGAVVQVLLTALLIAALWFIGFEASGWQATPGKRALGLRVETLGGARPSLWRAVLRFVAAGPSWLLLHLGHAMVSWRDDRRALHDLVAGTRVSGPSRLPAWAWAYLALQGLAVLALLGQFVVNLIRVALIGY